MRRGVLIGALLALLLGGCGSDDRPAATSGGAAATKAATASTARTPAPRMSKQLAPWKADRVAPKVGKFATLTPMVRTRAIIRMAASDDLLAVASGDFDGLTLTTGPPVVSGPFGFQVAKGASRIPWWADVHVGTDADGRTIVTYPHCTGPQYRTCRAMAWSPDDQRERPVGGLADVPGVVDVAQNRDFTVYRSLAGGRSDDSNAAPDPKLMLLATGEPAADARELPGRPSQSLELHGSTLAVIRDDSTGHEETDGGICGLQAVDLWHLKAPGAAQTVDHVICGLGGQYFTGVKLDATRARITMAANGEDGHALLRTYTPSTKRRTLRRLPGDPPEIVWLDDLHGITIGAIDACDARVDPSDPPAELPECPIGRITLKQP